MLQCSRFIMTALNSLNWYAAADGGVMELSAFFLQQISLEIFCNLVLYFCSLNHHIIVIIIITFYTQVKKTQVRLFSFTTYFFTYYYYTCSNRTSLVTTFYLHKNVLLENRILRERKNIFLSIFRGFLLMAVIRIRHNTSSTYT